MKMAKWLTFHGWFYHCYSQLNLTNECILWNEVWSDLNRGIANIPFQFLHIYAQFTGETTETFSKYKSLLSLISMEIELIFFSCSTRIRKYVSNLLINLFLLTQFKAYFRIIDSKQCPMKQMQLLLTLVVVSLTMNYVMCWYESVLVQLNKKICFLTVSGSY